MENNEEHEAEITRLVQVIEAGHVQEADRKAAEIMEKLDIQALNAGINKTVNPTSLEAAQSMRISMKDRYSVGWSDPRKFTIAQAKPDYNITFRNTVGDKQVQIGKLDFNGAMMKFDGNADASAIVFMDSLAQTFKGRLEAEHVNAAKLLLELVTFELEGEVELDNAYRKGFNDGMATCRAVLRKKIQEMERK
jgi:hypothetical protein